MKTYPRSLLIVPLVACAILATAAFTHAGEGSWRSGNGSARMTVWRVADFGTIIYLNLWIDGVKVTSLPRGVGYQATLRPGRHMVAISTSPNPYGQTRFTEHQVNLSPGDNSVFTVVWINADRVVFEPGVPAEYRYANTW